MIYDKTNSEILKEFNNHVYGHIAAKKTIIAAINRSKMRHHQKWALNELSDSLLKPSKILLVGDSGTGKSMLVDVASWIMNFPFVRIDATQLMPTGNDSGINQKQFKKLVTEEAKIWMQARQDRGYTHSLEGVIDQMAVFIDEADKLCNAFESSGNWNKHVQSNFLSIFDSYDWGQGITYIFAGAFSDMEGSSSVKRFGFSHDNYTDSAEDILDDRIIKHGLIPELVGRLTAIVELDKFNKEDYHYILTNILLPRKQYDLGVFNNSYIELSDEQKDILITKALKSKQGIRYLTRELDKLCLELEFSYEENAPQLCFPTSNDIEWGTL